MNYIAVKKPPAGEQKGTTSSRLTTRTKAGKGKRTLPLPIRHTIAPDMVLSTARKISDLRVKVETKEPIPLFKGMGAPLSLRNPFGGYTCVDTKESTLLKETMSRLFADKIYEFRISSAVDMSSSGAGLVNSVITNITLSSQTDFSALSSVFSEYFVKRFALRWEPVSQYNYPLTGVVATSVANLPLGVASLQHTQPAYTSLAEMANNLDFALHNTGRPFSHVWKNSERIDERIVTTPLTTVATQAWCMVGNAANYQGQVQFLTQTTAPLPHTEVLGTFVVDWDVAFRVRL
jgi:hypothetical protein